jgi:hypothetical protein
VRALHALLIAFCLPIPPALSPVPVRAQDEFLVNDDRIDRDQWAPRIARGAHGALVVVWMDGRNGTQTFVDFDTYSMAIRDPAAIGTSVNRRVNDDAAGAIQGYPDIAASPDGSFFCVWEDNRAGNRDIYGATLDSLGLTVTPNLRLNDDAGTTDQATPAVTAVGDSRYLVVWGDARGGVSDVYGSYRTSSGAAIGGNVKISSDPSEQKEPAVAADAAGLTLVAWRDARDSATLGATFDVYGQWLDAAGQPIGINFKINDTVTAQNDGSVCVAADSSLGFIVGWIDRRNSPSDPGDVYVQRFDASRSKVGANVRVNDDPIGRDQIAVRAFSVPGAAYLIWEDLRGGLGLDANVEASRIPYDASAPGANFRVNVLTPARQGRPAGVWDGRGAIAGVWEDARNGGQRPADIYALSFLESGVAQGTESQLNDDAAPNNQWRPRLGKGPGQYEATWIDLRGGGHNLYCQALTAASARDGPNYLLWKDDGILTPITSSAAVSPSGPGLIVAQITREFDAGEIRGFLMSDTGKAPSASFWISDSLPSSQSMPVAAATYGEFAVLWIDTREGTPRLYGQRLGLDGTRLGANHPALTVDPADPVYDLDMAVDPGGGYWICYAEGASANQRLWLGHVNAALVSDRSPIEVAPLLAGARSVPRIDVGPDRRAELVWLGTSAAGYGQVVYEAFDSTGAALGPPLELGPPTVPGPESAPSIAVAGSRSIVAWAGKQDGDWSIWLQGFDHGTAPFTAVVRVDQDVTGADQLDPTCGLDAGGHAVIIWSDARSTSSGTDILGRSMGFAPTSVLDPPDPWPVPEPPPPAPPPALRLAARPNPFSSSLALRVDVPDRGARRVTVRVVNVRGEVVATLHDGPVAAGPSFFRWDGAARNRDAASGVYWIVVQAGEERHALRVVHLR